MNAAIQDATQQAASARQDASTAQQIANDARNKAAALRTQYRAGQINAAQFRASLASFSTSLRSLQDISKGQAEEIDLLRKSALTSGGAAAGTFNRSSADMASSKAALDRAIADLAATTRAEPI